jgi:alpha-1,6-mannosyltransferase
VRHAWRNQVAALVAALVCEIGLLCALNWWGDLTIPGNPVRFVAGMLAAGVAYAFAGAAFQSLRGDQRPRLLWIAALVMRLVVLPMAPGDDLARYQWEGRIQLAGVNPYLTAPDSPAVVHLRDDGSAGINHPEWAAIYPPATELMFKAIAHFGGTRWLFKAVFLVADLGILLFLLKLLTGPGRYRAAAWYAWNPAAIVAFSGMAHFDSVMVLMLVIAVWALHRANPIGACPPAWSWSVVSAVFLGLAIALKTVPLLLIPVWICALRGRSVVLVATLLIPWLFSLAYGGLMITARNIVEYSQVARFNELVWWLPERLGIIDFLETWVIELGGWIQISQHNQIYNVCAAIAAVAAALYFRNDWRKGFLAALGAVLLLSPLCHPWYPTWILPVACWRKARPWLVLSISVWISLLVWQSGPFWSEWNLTWPLRFAIVGLPLAFWWIERLAVRTSPTA